MPRAPKHRKWSHEVLEILTHSGAHPIHSDVQSAPKCRVATLLLLQVDFWACNRKHRRVSRPIFTASVDCSMGTFQPAIESRPKVELPIITDLNYLLSLT